MARVEGRLRCGAGWVSTMLQRLVLSLWQDPAVAGQIAAASESYQRRRARLCRELAARELAAQGRTGINVWVPVLDETRAVAALREAGYAVAPGALYRLASPPGVRITISPLAEADLPALAEAIAVRWPVEHGRCAGPEQPRHQVCADVVGNRSSAPLCSERRSAWRRAVVGVVQGEDP